MSSVGESLAQVEARLQTGITPQNAAAAAEVDAKRNAWLAMGLSMEEIAVLMSSEAKKLRKQARHQAVTSVMTRERFAQHAKPIEVAVGKVPYSARVKYENPDKSLGWTISEQTTVVVDGVRLPATLSFNLTINGTKPLK